MDQQELRAKLKAVMEAHLRTKGYPRMTSEQIMRELKPMWIAIEEAGLVQQGMSFQGFREQAMFALVKFEYNRG